MNFNLNKLTVKAQEAVQNGIEIAQNYNNQILEPEHLLAALIQESGNIANSILQKTGGNVVVIKVKVNGLIEALPKVTGAGIGNQQMSNNLAKLFDTALQEANTLKDDYVSTEHLLIALSEEKGKAGQLLRDNGVSKNNILAALKDVRGTQRVTSQNAEDTYQSLEKYGNDLIELAKAGKLDPVIGRDEEIRRVLQVLSRRTKNNPVLIGEAGVGKTAIVEGLAQQIVNGEAPNVLLNKRVVVLDMALLVAGTVYRGQFEERIKNVMKEVKKDGLKNDAKVVFFAMVSPELLAEKSFEQSTSILDGAYIQMTVDDQDIWSVRFLVNQRGIEEESFLLLKIQSNGTVLSKVGGTT